jgi:ferredoxin
MADPKSRGEKNLPGKYYVDDQCIACDACVMEAELFFMMDDDEGLAYVYRQPINKDEEEVCENALAACPVEAIGNNG